jgi:hypothetical protein
MTLADLPGGTHVTGGREHSAALTARRLRRAGRL